MTKVDQMEESENCDLSQKGNTFTATVYNIRKEHSQQFLCMGINELGQCSQSFKVIVKGQTLLCVCLCFLQLSMQPHSH